MPRRILVVDDNDTVRYLVQRVLETAGYVTAGAANGYEALEIYRNSNVDGAIVDVDMPGLNGIEVCRLLHAHAAALRRQMHVWIMTGVARPDLITSAAAAGAICVLEKPIPLRELIEHIEAKLPRHADAPAAV